MGDSLSYLDNLLLQNKEHNFSFTTCDQLYLTVTHFMEGFQIINTLLHLQEN